MAITLGAITLPGDLQWIDEFTWLPTAQQVDITTGGSLLVEESKQLAGRPITLAADFAWIQRSVISALWTLAAEPLAAPLVLTLEDARTFNIRFRFADGSPVEARPIRLIAPALDADPYSLILRTMQV